MRLEITDKYTAKCNQEELNLSWKSNPAVQKLLDVIAYILANEYVCTVKENPTVFTEIASAASLPRNDSGMDSRFRGSDNARKDGR